jgi:hypothetical protein
LNTSLLAAAARARIRFTTVVVAVQAAIGQALLI